MASEEARQADGAGERDAQQDTGDEHTAEGQSQSNKQPDSKMREVLDQVIEKIQEMAPVVGEKLQEGAGVVARTVREVAPVVGERMREGAGAAARKVQEGVTKAGVALEDLRDRVADRGGQRGAGSHQSAEDGQEGRPETSEGSDAGSDEPDSAPLT
jgi:hypothetical protein